MNKTRIYLTRRGSRLWLMALVCDMNDEILRRRRQGKTETLYTWGRGTQVETIRNQGWRQTSDTGGRVSDLKREESYFQNKTGSSQDRSQDKTTSPRCDKELNISCYYLSCQLTFVICNWRVEGLFNYLCYYFIFDLIIWYKSKNVWLTNFKLG